MKRRDALIGSALMAGAVSNSAFAADGKSLGDSIIPPSQEMGKEKHVPIITAPSSAKAGEPFMVTVEVGKTVPHPNTKEHHIKWIQLYAKYEDSRYVIELGTFNFGAGVAQPKVTVPVMLDKNATLFALEHCNIHGIWDNSVEISIS